MKKYLLMALAALSFAACAEKGEDNTSTQNGELEQSYVAVTLTADDINTRADDRKYEEGLDVERAVKSAYVFFFEDAHAVTVALQYTGDDGGSKTGVIHVGVARHQHKVGLIPAALFHIRCRNRQKRHGTSLLFIIQVILPQNSLVFK